MTETIFEYCEEIRKEYLHFSRSFSKIRADDIKKFVREMDKNGEYTPEPLVQINPSYEQGGMVSALEGIHSDCSEIFQREQKPITLYKHQEQAWETARAGKNFIITTGTGSGKSVSYFLPIVNAVLKAKKQPPRTSAIVCYPMNALVNSQEEELSKFLGEEEKDRKVTFAKYTAQTSTAERLKIAESPPDILLTNYMMLELMLVRNRKMENDILNNARGCQFLVMDELHTYRGRQGADVAMLIRRLRERLCGETDGQFLCVGTSATMTADEAEDSRDPADVVAQFASRFFGAPFEPSSIISETLKRKTDERQTESTVRPFLAEAIAKNDIPQSEEAFKKHPVAIWAELRFGVVVNEQGEKPSRKPPAPIQSVAEELGKITGKTQKECEKYLHHFLGNAAKKAYFGIRLHQFFSGPGKLQATIEKENDRQFSVTGEQYVVGDSKEKRYFPLHFCRDCGHEFYCVSAEEDIAIATCLMPRDIEDVGSDKDRRISFGFITPKEPDMLWDEQDITTLPDTWLTQNRSGDMVIKPDKRKFVPLPVTVAADGTIDPKNSENNYILLPGRFHYCPKCGEVHEGASRDKTRLASLNGEGRSSTSTIVFISMLRHAISKSYKKLLAFSDNRQDAALQSGHFNDFIFHLKLRAGLLRALSEADGGLDQGELPEKVAQALGYETERVINDEKLRSEFMSADVTDPDAVRRNYDCLRDVLAYMLMHDLRRSWRYTNPNLESLGLLKIEYLGLSGIGNDDCWRQPELANIKKDKREEICREVLTALKGEQCIDSRYMSDEFLQSIKARSSGLHESWRYDEHEKWEQAHGLIIDKLSGNISRSNKSFFRSGGPRSRLGKRLKLRRSDWFDKENILASAAEHKEMLAAILRALQNRDMVVQKTLGGHQYWQLNGNIIRWKKGGVATDENQFYVSLYEAAEKMLGNPERRKELSCYKSREHTAQVDAADREQRERDFRDENEEMKLPILVCSPTMELGIDISKLNAVFLRNVPPTPANYVQRSGRAGRAGEAAIIITYCASQSPHDQYFHANKEKMIVGQIKAPSLDLANQDLLTSHIHSIWLQKTGVPFDGGIANVMDYQQESCPIKPDVEQSLKADKAKEEAVGAATKIMDDLLSGDFIARDTAPWLNNDFPQQTVENAYVKFGKTLDRWRGVFQATKRQIEINNRRTEDVGLSSQEREEAGSLSFNARKQRDLLLSDGGNNSYYSDFNAYRFLASHGFLPGYNFPRLPLMAYLPATHSRHRRGGAPSMLSRPRFLAISEFGPQNFIYHEGQRFRVHRAFLNIKDSERAADRILPVEAITLCNACGHAYFEKDRPDLCRCCDIALGDEKISDLYRIDSVATRRADRINADEEERQRHGFDMLTAYQFNFSNGKPVMIKAALKDADDNIILRLSYGSAATIFRINQGWRRRTEADKGFLINPITGEWGKKPNDDATTDNTPAEQAPAANERIIPYVEDRRNILIIRPEDLAESESLTTFMFALKRGILETFQLEENELAVEQLPNGNTSNAFLFYESTEGGAGVLTRLISDDGRLFAQIARAALSAMHYKMEEQAANELPDLQEEANACNTGCYRCLLSYYNQPQHETINRKNTQTLEWIQRIRNCRLEKESQPADNGNDNGDSAWQKAAATADWRPPDAQNKDIGSVAQADYYYKEVRLAVFIGDDVDIAQIKEMEEKHGIIVAHFPADQQQWEAKFQHYKPLVSV